MELLTSVKTKIISSYILRDHTKRLTNLPLLDGSVFRYFAGRSGEGCSLLGAGCNLWGVGHDLGGAGCEMLSLILELQTCQLGLCFAHLVTIH